MPLDEDLKIKIVLAMAKLDYLKLVTRHFQRENLPVIPCEKTVRGVFDKFLETGSIQSVILLVKLTCQHRWCIE